MKHDRDQRYRYDEDGNEIPPKTGADRQKWYEWRQSQDGKKRPGWWLSDEVVQAITRRRWSHSGDTKSDSIDGALRYMLRIVEAVEAQVEDTGNMPEDDALALVLEKIAALEVPYVPPPTEEELEAERLEFLKSAPPAVQRLYCRKFGNP